jgi:molybdopterin-guanine dinucleotide biosynthesis protein A
MPFTTMFSLAILAGGDSKRMGQEKALLPFLGRPLIERVLEQLSGLAGEIIISTNRPDQFAFLGLPMVADIFPNRGVLGGLYSSLLAVHSPLMAAVACDMPFASRAVFEFERDLMESGNQDVVIPNGTHGMEPLHAVYRRDACLQAIQQALDAGESKLISWMPNVKTYFIPSAKIADLDPLDIAFWNLNTPEDFRQAEERAFAQNSQGGQ